MRKIFIYLDYNVILGLKKKEYSNKIVKSLEENPYIHITYCPIHIAEIENIKEPDSEKRLILIAEHLQYLSRLTKNLYFQFYSEINRFELVTVRPIEIYKDYYKKFQGGKFITNLWADLFPSTLKKTFREVLNLVPKELNNIEPQSIFTEIDKIVSFQLQGKSIYDLIRPIFFSNQGDEKQNHEKTMILFEILNYFGYWKDKNKRNLDISRVYDILHTGYAIYTEIFVTDDVKTKMKALAVYSFLDINTKVITTKEAPEEVIRCLYKKNNMVCPI